MGIQMTQEQPSPVHSETVTHTLLEETLPTLDLTVDPPQPLPAVLNTRDLTIFMLLIILFISNNNGVQFGGPATFIYWILGCLTFLLPTAYITRWLARQIPGQGAPYLWAAHIIGANWSFFAAFCAWIPGVLSVVSAIEAGIVLIQYLVPTWFTTPLTQCLAILLVLAIATSLACLPLLRLKNMLGILALCYVSTYFVIGLAGVLWLVQGHSSAVDFSQAASWQPNWGNTAIYGLVVLALLGVDVPLFMGGEIRGGRTGARRASNFVWWGLAITMLAYVLGTFGIMVIVPINQAGAMTANVQAVQMVFGSFAGNIVDGLLASSQITITIAYLLMFSRLLYIVAKDRRLPTTLTKLNRHGVPINSIVVQGGIVAAIAILSFVGIPLLFGSFMRPEDLAVDIYNILLAGATAMWSFSTALLFFFVVLLLFRRTKQTAQIISQRIQLRKGQKTVLLSMSILGIVASLLGIWSTTSSSWIPTLIPDRFWSIFVWSSIILSLAIGWIGSELPRMHASLSEQRRVTDREVLLRTQLEEAYSEQKIIVEQQQELLAEVNRLYRERSQAAITDTITGLPNHRAVMSRLEEEIARCQRSQGSCAVLFIDLDHFKRINDTWGHRAGDAILQEVGSRLRTTLRLEDFVGRYGGEEFAIVLTDVDLGEANRTAERICSTIALEPCMWMAEDTQTVVSIPVTCSIGVALYTLHGLTREALVEHADQAMYQAKHAGRNCVRIADIDISSLKASSSTVASNTHERQPQQDVPIPIQAVQAFIAVASAHDQGTDAHSHRIVSLAEATALKLNLPESEIHLVHLASLLHDIGKIGIPDAILHKPAPLTGDEWTVMRRHPEIGRQILTQVGGIFQHLAPIVVAHHERWDGSGYPHKLAGEAIPLVARIITVVDSYDAMTSRRPYRQPMPVAEARAELQRCTSTQFDPRVVTAFLQVLADQEEKAQKLLAQSPDPASDEATTAINRHSIDQEPVKA